MQFSVIHGPNLNLLGTREPATYGTTTLSDINASIDEWATKHGVTVSAFQSNLEGELVNHIQSIGATADGIVINPAAYTHTSIAIRDALIAIQVPTIEVHISNTDARESFRHHSTISDIVVGRILGLGAVGYTLALSGLLSHLRGQSGS
jgi:3-dehydroquinate dehydratase-2